MPNRIKSNKNRNFTFNLNFKLITAVLISIISIWIAKNCIQIKNEQTSLEQPSEKLRHTVVKFKSLRYWGVCIRKWNPKGNLRTMNRVFRKLGYKFVNASNGDDWDVLWSIEYPFESDKELFDPLEDIEPNAHQRINHFPGIYFITNKQRLAEKTRSKYLLPTFAFPGDAQKFHEYIANNPSTKFVEKKNTNRGVKIIDKSEINFEPSSKIYQKFFHNPYLIDGHAFDFGLYVLITSVNPIRIYRYHQDVFIRFCPEEYLPFDPNNTKKYVVDESHLGAYYMPSFEDIYWRYGYSVKSIFEHIISEKGHNVEKLWAKIDDAINSIVLQNEQFIIDEIDELFESTHHFFELVRFDFVFDENLNPFVMEVNMSPNLTPTQDKFEDNALIYEQLVYNTLNLISASNYDDYTSRLSNDSITSNFKNIATNLEECYINHCEDDCDNPACNICLPCVNNYHLFQMHESYREHLRRGNFKRIFPASIHFDDAKLFKLLKKNNQVMLKWFKAQCKIDKNWC